MSPQVLQGVYTSQADLWAIGVVSYMLLSNTKPFYSSKRKVMIDLIMRGEFYFDSPAWPNISAEGKDFVQKLLVVDPKNRMTARDALHHPWIVDRNKWHDDKPSEKLLSELDTSLLNYRQTSQLKKLALTVIAHRSTAQDLIQLRSIFDRFDTEKNGVLTFEEFKAALEKMGYPDKDISDIFESIDLNQNGQIMYTEFLAATIEVHGSIEEARIAEAFDTIDADQNGYSTFLLMISPSLFDSGAN
jgi:serine/threonine protein kinase